MGFIFKIARTEKVFQQIHRLNYRTFVEEIPQHQQNEQGVLIDEFHNENTYLVCFKEDDLIGMIAVRGNRPFSLDKKLGDFTTYLPIKSDRPCEIRLLAVEKEFRNGRVFLGLAQLLARYCLKEGYDTAVISGTTRQQKLYMQMGFEPFAFLTGTGDALYQPMYLTRETFEKSLSGRIKVEPVSFLPGPVMVEEKVKHAMLKTPISHRSKRFLQTLHRTQERLRKLTNSTKVQILTGTGTLANDVIAGQLSLLEGKGLILVSGEFGERLVDHGRRAGLTFTVIKKEWGKQILYSEIEAHLREDNYSWLWSVHCETSTGMLFNLDELKRVCLNNNVKLCLDCISSIGTLPLDLKDVYLASGVSGKAIGSFTGLSFVFHDHTLKKASHLPRYIDLEIYASNNTIPFSFSSNMLEALLAALAKFETVEYYDRITSQYAFVRKEMDKLGMTILSERKYSCPGIITIVLPKEVNSKEIGMDLYLQGFQLHYESSYLQKQNWIQISFMNLHEKRDITKMVNALGKLITGRIGLTN